MGVFSGGGGGGYFVRYAKKVGTQYEKFLQLTIYTQNNV